MNRPLHIKNVPGELIIAARKVALDDDSNLRLRVIDLLDLTQTLPMEEIRKRLS